MDNYLKIEELNQPNQQQSSFIYDTNHHHQQQHQQQQQLSTNPCYVYDQSLNHVQNLNFHHNTPLNDDELSAAIGANYQLLSNITNEYYAQTNYLNSLQQYQLNDAYQLTDPSTSINDYYSGSYVPYSQSLDFTASSAAAPSMNLLDNNHQPNQQQPATWNPIPYYPLNYVPPSTQTQIVNDNETLYDGSDIYNNNSDYSSTATATAAAPVATTAASFVASNSSYIPPIACDNAATASAAAAAPATSTINAESKIVENNQKSIADVQQQPKNTNNSTRSVVNGLKSASTSNQSVDELAKKLELKRERNRIAARKCRNKKLQQIEELQRTNDLLRKDIEKSIAELDVLNARKFELRAAFLNALSHVPLVSEDAKQI